MEKRSNNDIFFETHKAIDKMIEGKEKELAREYLVALNSIKLMLSDAYEKYGVDGILNREEAVKYGRLAKIEQHIIEQIQKLTKIQVRITKESILNTFTDAYYRYGYMIENASELAIYSMLSQEIINQMLYNELDTVTWEERIEENNNVLVRQLREELTTGLIQGLTYTAVAKSVSERLNIGANKAKKIVRTETRRVQEEANLKSMQDAKKKGIITKKQWVSTLDSRTRDTHKHLDGKVVDIDDYFVSRSGKKALAPHKFGVAKEDINCRCTMISVIEIDGKVVDNGTRRARNNGDNEISEVISYKNYNEWKKDLEGR